MSRNVVLVCGGRDFRDVALLNSELDLLHAESPIDCIVEGGAHGADSYAKRWASENCVDVDEYPADWRIYGKPAGPIRNQKMLSEGRPSLVLAFAGGRGTASMIRLARKAGVEVREISRPQPSGKPVSHSENLSAPAKQEES
jgi:hypothetical protein